MLDEKFKAIAENIEDLNNLPLEYAKEVRNNSSLEGLDSQRKKEALRYIRLWTDFAREINLDPNNLFAVRYAVSEFAEKHFAESVEPVRLQSADISALNYGGKNYQDMLSVDPAIFSDPEVAVFGGSARLALKILAKAPIESELPVSDVDLIAHTSADVASKSRQYGADLTGTRVVGGEDLEAGIERLLENIDCSMNQCVVHKGKLYYTEQGLEDVRQGNIRVLAKKDPLFGSEGQLLPNGHVYLNKRGFYRGLSFLLRKKGERLLVSEENLEAEKDNIGRYWLVMLYVKLLKIKDPTKRDESVSQWFSIAKKIGSTTTGDPLDFFYEQKNKFPEMRFYSSANLNFDMDQQVRWIINKLVSRVSDRVMEQENKPEQLPDTYSAADITLPPPVQYDLTEFYEATTKAG